MPTTKQYQSWGGIFKPIHQIKTLYFSTSSLPEISEGKTLLPYGCGRSYGDSCLNDKNYLLYTRKMNHFLYFDKDNGLLKCEAGVTFDDILKVIVPHGWFLPVVPGTRYITVGGAIANDIHGKNHHKAGTFGCYIKRFELLRSDGIRYICTPTLTPEFYQATIGGLGLTGLITWAEIQLQAIPNPYIEAETIKFNDIKEFCSLSTKSEQQWDYTVAWIDCMARGKNLGRGVFFRGKSNIALPRQKNRPSFPLTVPFYLPSFSLNKWSISLFNNLYYHKHYHQKNLIHYEPFFFPLDSITHWNRIYGKRGFFQYQFVLPIEKGIEPMIEILDRIAFSKQGSFLGVLKIFGPIKSPGLLSFPKTGLTLALDFPNRGISTLKLFDALDSIVKEAGGRIYPAKDARMSADMFQTTFPEWKLMEKYIDPLFSSSFWRRVTL